MVGALGVWYIMQPRKCEMATVFISQMMGWVKPTLYHCHLKELSRALWNIASRDVTEQYSCTGEVVYRLFCGDWHHFWRGCDWFGKIYMTTKWCWWDRMWSFLPASWCIESTQCIIYYRWGGGGSGGTTHYWVITLTTTVYNQILFQHLFFGII